MTAPVNGRLEFRFRKWRGPSMKSDQAITGRLEDLDDAALVERAQQRDGAAFWLIIKRHNQRLYRVARAVLDDDTEAEDVVQETYIHAFTHLSEFRAEARLSTWLTRIALNEALGRRRQRRPTVDVKAIEAMAAPFSAHELDPEQAAALEDIRRLLERAVSGLPERYRIVFVMRDVEEMSIEETALLLGLRPADREHTVASRPQAAAAGAAGQARRRVYRYLSLRRRAL